MTDHSSHRDTALMAALASRAFVHLTYVRDPGVRIEQGWLHLHNGQLECCTTQSRNDCAAHRARVADTLGDRLREYLPVDVDRLIRIDASITQPGHYVPLWHHPEQIHVHHGALTRADLACCQAPEAAP